MTYPTWKGRVMDAEEDNWLAIVGPIDGGPAVGDSLVLCGRRLGQPDEVPVTVEDVDGALVLVRLPSLLALALFDIHSFEWERSGR